MWRQTYAPNSPKRKPEPMTNFIHQAWDFPEGKLELRVSGDRPFRPSTIADLGAVVLAIEEFLDKREPDMPDWERKLLTP